MNKALLIFSILALSSSAYADGAFTGNSRTGGAYEAALRQAGVPISGGLAWAVRSPRSAAVPQAPALENIGAKPVSSATVKGKNDA